MCAHMSSLNVKDRIQGVVRVILGLIRTGAAGFSPCLCLTPVHSLTSVPCLCAHTHTQQFSVMWRKHVGAQTSMFSS